MKEAAKTWGFFQIINHGVPVSVLDDTVKAIEAFHDLPIETKASYYKREEGRGVMYASNNDLYRTSAASWHDSLQMWMAPEAAKVEERICRKEVVEWDLHATKVADTVLELLSEGLGLEGDKFKELTFSESRVMLGHCYPFCPQPDLTMGITPHTDVGTITVLLQNHVPGLQVKHDGEWVDVDPVHGGLIINVGDFLQADVEVTFSFSCLDKAEAFDPSWVNAQDLCAQKGSKIEGGVGPFGLLTLASINLEEFTPVFFRIFKAPNKHMILLCSDARSSSLKSELYKPSFAGFVDVDLSTKKLSLRSLIDHSVVESFGAGGKTNILSRVYPELALTNQAHLFVFNNGTEPITVENLNAWSMKSVEIN